MTDGKMTRWTPVRLLLSRIVRFLREQYRIWGTALDWTVLLYIAVPGLWMLGGLWLEMLREPPDWLAAIPAELAPPLLALLLFKGRLRTFREEADVLTLLQRGSWIRTLKLGGAVYTLLAMAISTALTFALLLPWLRLHGAFDAGGLALWAAFTLACRLLAAAARRLVDSLLRGRKRGAAHVALAAALVALYAGVVPASDGRAGMLGACTAAAFAGGAAAVGALLRLRGGHEADLRAELRARTAAAGLLVSAAGVERKPEPIFRRPLLFPRSGRILRASDPGAVLAEMRIKSFLRRSPVPGFRLVAVPTVALAAVPDRLAPLLAAILMAMIASWLQRDFREWMDEPYLAQFRWKEADVRRGASLSRFGLMLPAAAWFAGVAGWRLAGWAGLAAAVPLGICLWVMINGFMHDLPAVKPRPADTAERDADA